MKQFGAMISLEWVGATGKSALFMAGMQRFDVTGKASSFQGQGAVHAVLVGNGMGRMCMRNYSL